MKDWASIVVALLIPTASLALGEDFKTVNGKEYKDATITRVEGDGIVIRSKTGISKIYFVELPKDVQEKFHYSQATPIAAQREREPIKLESTQDGSQHVHGGGKVVVVGQRSGPWQAESGGRVVVVGQSPVSLKVVLAGIVLLVVVVLAVVRSRF
jgi:hypothetical protein